MAEEDAALLEAVTSAEERRMLLTLAEQRRSQADGLMWELPALSLTAQAFLLTITLRPDTPNFGRVVSALAGLVFAFGAFRGMLEHRRNEELLSRWLEYCETRWALPPVHKFGSIKRIAREKVGAPEPGTRWLQWPFLPGPHRGFKAFNLWASVLFGALVLDFALLTVAILDWTGATNLFAAS